MKSYSFELKLCTGGGGGGTYLTGVDPGFSWGGAKWLYARMHIMNSRAIWALFLSILIFDTKWDF